ncbi:hypothetical protein P9112_009728 [Eukaryota sp. TZLM1-RC]
MFKIWNLLESCSILILKDCSVKMLPSSVSTAFDDSYVDKNNVLVLFENMMSSLLVDKPSNPLAYLQDILPHIDVPRIVLAGGPASGKGTQCEKIVERFNVVHISTGDLLRAAIKEKTAIGVEAQEFMKSGSLVPDNLIINLVNEALSKPEVKKKGWLLDGYPRTVSQARALVLAGHIPHCFINLHVPDEVLIERICGRRMDPETGIIYHVVFKPPPPAIEDRLVIRDDDNEETARNRISQYHTYSECVADFFSDIHVKVDGCRNPDSVFEDVETAIKTVARAVPPRKRPRIFCIGKSPFETRALASRIAQASGVVHVSPLHLLRDIGVSLEEFLSGSASEAVIAALSLRVKSTDCLDRGWVAEFPVSTVTECQQLLDLDLFPNKVVLSNQMSFDETADGIFGVPEWDNYIKRLSNQIDGVEKLVKGNSNCAIYHWKEDDSLNQVSGRVIEWLRQFVDC